MHGWNVTDTFAKIKAAPWGAMEAQHHIITIEGETFDYWGSIIHPEVESLAEVVDMIVSDAIIGEESFGEMCAELGFDDPQQALDSWEGCKETARKVRKFYSGDLYDLGRE